MLVSDFDYFLPKELIAQTAVEPRDGARLLVYNNLDDKIEHGHVFDFVNYLKEGDVLVLNDSKVFPARLKGKRLSSLVAVEVFLVHQINNDGLWQVMVKMNRPKANEQIDFADDFYCRLVETGNDGTWQVEFNVAGEELWQMINHHGKTPLPPYIHQDDNNDLRQRYQTVYAREVGSVAAPTAGLHLTAELIKKIEAKGVIIARVTLHVGLGTFQAVKAEVVEDYKLHSEWALINQVEAEKINKAKKENKRVVAVGTTTVRVLEAWSDEAGLLKQTSGWLNIFIFPGYKFKCVDCLLTNFHLPKSSLLMLVSALVGQDKILYLYNLAVENKYRFYSFGDAMFLITKT